MAKLTLLILALLLGAQVQAADIVVIANAQNPVAELGKKQVVDLFMGRVSSFPDGIPANTLDLRPGTPLRADFYRRLTGKSEAQVDAYWATLVFAGRMSPPKQFSSEQKLIREVARDKSAIAYVSRQALPKNVTVVMELPSP